jgi:hypothetical protein
MIYLTTKFTIKLIMAYNSIRVWSNATGNMYHKYCILPTTTIVKEDNTTTLTINITKDIYTHCVEDNVCNMLESVLSMLNGSSIMIATCNITDSPPKPDAYKKLICDGSHCHEMCALLQFICKNESQTSLNFICPHVIDCLFTTKIECSKNTEFSSYGQPLCYIMHITGQQDNCIYIKIVEDILNLYIEDY